MDENKNSNIGSPAPENRPVANVRSAPDEADMYDYSDPDAYWDEYIYDASCRDSMCMSCIYWNGHACAADQSICNYEPC